MFVSAVLMQSFWALEQLWLIDSGRLEMSDSPDCRHSGQNLYPLLQPADTILGLLILSTKLEFQYYRLETGGLQFPHPVHRTPFLSVIMCPTCQCANLCFNLPKLMLSERNQYVTVEEWL